MEIPSAGDQQHQHYSHGRQDFLPVQRHGRTQQTPLEAVNRADHRVQCVKHGESFAEFIFDVVFGIGNIQFVKFRHPPPRLTLRCRLEILIYAIVETGKL